MPKKISFFLHDYQPNSEALSQEAYILHSNLTGQEGFQSAIHEIATKCKFRFSSTRICYPNWMLPLGYFATRYLQNNSDLIHIIGSVTGKIYLKILDRRPAVLTCASAIKLDKIETCKNYWPKLDLIIVECNRDKKLLLQNGIHHAKLQLIYPGVQSPKPTAPPKGKKFKILFASAPISKAASEFSSKGIDLILQTAPELTDCEFTLLWRGRHLDKIKRLLTDLQCNNVILHNALVRNMKQFYAQFHAVILVPTKEDSCKPCPHSFVEALALGKPVIASRHIGISDLVETEQCGVVCEAEKNSLQAGIEKLRRSYEQYQKRCIPVARDYFSYNEFIRQYKKIYSLLLDQ